MLVWTSRTDSGSLGGGGTPGAGIMTAMTIVPAAAPKAARLRAANPYARAAFTAAATNDRPYTPVTVAIWRTPPYGTSAYPDNIHGKPLNKYVRSSSTETHSEGASQRARRPMR